MLLYSSIRFSDVPLSLFVILIDALCECQKLPGLGHALLLDLCQFNIVDSHKWPTVLVEKVKGKPRNFE